MSEFVSIGLNSGPNKERDVYKRQAITPVRLMGAALIIGGAIFCELAGKRANAKASIAQTARA